MGFSLGDPGWVEGPTLPAPRVSRPVDSEPRFPVPPSWDCCGAGLTTCSQERVTCHTHPAMLCARRWADRWGYWWGAGRYQGFQIGAQMTVLSEGYTWRVGKSQNHDATTWVDLALCQAKLTRRAGQPCMAALT